jgi:putative methanogenesis marker 16 metalloprotein
MASSIFNAIPMEGNFKSFSFSGCGEINPLQNDPEWAAIKKGSNVLLNGSKGIILGEGTRSSEFKPNFMLAADMDKMSSKYIGGFITPEGPEVFDSVGIPIPVLNEKIFSNLMVLNKDIPLPIADIHGRHLPISETNYENVWKNFDLRPKFHEDKCINCELCLAEERCPTNAFTNKKGNKNLDLKKCFGCGICKYSCLGDGFEMNTGSVMVKTDERTYNVPIACRQSDLKRAKIISTKLKNMIENQEFDL